MKSSGKEDKMHLPGDRPLVPSPPLLLVSFFPRLRRLDHFALGFGAASYSFSRVGLAPSFSTFLIRPSRKSKPRRKPTLAGIHEGALSRLNGLTKLLDLVCWIWP